MIEIPSSDLFFVLFFSFFFFYTSKACLSTPSSVEFIFVVLLQLDTCTCSK